jgi:hypothetical protein
MAWLGFLRFCMLPLCTNCSKYEILSGFFLTGCLLDLSFPCQQTVLTKTAD